MPYIILANHKQTKYYNYLKEKLYSYSMINITDDYEWVKNGGMTYEHIDDKKLQQLKQYSSEILLMKQLIFALCIDKRNPHFFYYIYYIRLQYINLQFLIMANTFFI